MLGRLNVLGIPSFRQVISPEGKSFTAYQVQLVYNGTVLSFEKRYSEFYNLQKKLHKIIDAKADFPPKKVLNKDPKFLEVRRQGLENYLQMVFHELPEDIPYVILDFFDIDPTADRLREDEPDVQIGDEPQRTVYNHQTVITFDKDAFLNETVSDEEENHRMASIILNGCFNTLYDQT